MFFFKLIGDCILGLYWISQSITLGERKGVHAEAKLWRKINPWHVVDLSSDIFLPQSSLEKSLIHIIRDFYSFGKIGYAHWVKFVKI